MDRVDEMTTPPIVGRYYLVPCVYVDPKIPTGRGRWLSASEETVVLPYHGVRAGWWPIFGPRHEDGALLDFHPYHWHYDPRFFSARQMGSYARTTSIFARPLSDYGGLKGPEYCRRRFNYELGPLIPDGITNLAEKLEPHFTDATLRGPCKVCPHRGLPLASLPVDEQGHVTCPGHGLTWDVSTGKLVRRSLPARERRR